MSSPAQPVPSNSHDGATQKKRHVLLLNHVSRVSGGEQGLLNIVASVDPGRYRFTVVVPPGDLAERVQDAGAGVETFTFQRFKRTRNPLLLARYACGYLLGIARLTRMIRRLRPDLVHSNSNTAHLYGGRAARLAEVPAIWHSRDLVKLGRLGPWMFKTCHACVAISQAVASHLAGCADDPDKIRVIHNGIDTTRFSPREKSGAVRGELGISPDSPLLGTVGQLVPWKKHERFIDAAGRIAGQVPNARFVVVGDDLFGDHPDYREQLLDRATRRGLDGKLYFAGYRDDIVPVLADLDVFVHATDREPFGRAIAEAMAMGLPVVAIDANGPAEIIRNGVDGVLVPLGDAAALAAAVTGLLESDAIRAASGQAARKRIVQAFGREAFGRRMTELYDEVLACE